MNIIEKICQLCSENNIDINSLSTLEDIMNAEVKTLTMDHTIESCRKFMQDYNIRHVPVVDFIEGVDIEPRFVGVVSNRDVLRVAMPYLARKGAYYEVDKKALRQLLGVIVERDYDKTSFVTPVYRVLQMMLERRIDMVAIMDGEKLKGIITTIDLLKIYKKIEKYQAQIIDILDNALETGSDDNSLGCIREWMTRPVSELMTKNVICVMQDDDIETARKTMQNYKFRHLPVIDNKRRVKGIVSDRDILRHLPFAGKRPPYKSKVFRDYLFKVDDECLNLKLGIAEVMTKRVKTLRPESSVFQAANLLYKKRFGSVPIVDQDGAIEGILSVADLLRNLQQVYDNICESAPMQAACT